MEVPTPPAALAALANFVRSRLAEVQDTLAPLWPSASRSVERAAPVADGVRTTARQIATVIVSAAAPFAQNSYARTRLIRQMHASGLLTDAETRQAETLLQE